MKSQEPYVNLVIYHIQTKLGVDVPHDLAHDINCSFWNYGRACCEQSTKEKNEWQEAYFRRVK